MGLKSHQSIFSFASEMCAGERDDDEFGGFVSVASRSSDLIDEKEGGQEIGAANRVA